MNTKLTSVIIDDEPIAAKNLEFNLNKYCSEIKNVGKAYSLDEGINLIMQAKPMVIFLDISLASDESGFDLLDILQGYNFEVVFVTAYPNYSIKAIKRRAFDYILKPIDYRELIKCSGELSKKYYSKKEIKPNVILLPSSDGTHLLDPAVVSYCKADGSYTHIYLSDGKNLTFSKSIKHAEKLLHDPRFLRVHRSYIINIEKITKLHLHESGYLEIGDKLIPVSKPYWESLNKLFH